MFLKLKFTETHSNVSGYMFTDHFQQQNAVSTCQGTNSLFLFVLFSEITCDRKNYPNAAIAGPDKDKYENKEEAVYDCIYGGQFTLTCGKTGWTGSDECSGKEQQIHC